MPQGFTMDPPIVTSLVTCDGFNQSVIDQKHSLIGLWDDIGVAQFPVTILVTAIATLAGVLEQLDVQLYIVQLNADLTETKTPFGAVNVVMPPTVPGALMNNVVVHSPFTFSTPGRYDLRVEANGAFLAYKPIIIRQMGPPGSGPLPFQVGGSP